MADVLDRRHPACGSELEHGPHEYHDDYWPDGRVLQHRETPAYCAGWTAAEADLCRMLRAVLVVMAEKNPPDGSKRFRLEASPLVVNGLQGLFLPSARPGREGLAVRVDQVSGADLVIMPHLPPGAWQLVEVLPHLLAGTVRS